MKKWSPTAKLKTCILCNMKQDMKVMKNINHDNVKFCNKNVNVVEKNYIKHKSILQWRGSLCFIG